MSEELELLREVGNKLDNLQIDYMITGSIAANYYSIPRMTRDIDIVIELHQKDVPNLFKAFASDYYIDEISVGDAVKESSIFNIIHNTRQIKIDFICKKSTVYRKVEFERRIKVELDDFSIWLVSAEDLVLSKLDWAKESRSEMQIKDVLNLIRSSPEMDKAYLRHWASQLGISDLLEEVLL